MAKMSGTIPTCAKHGCWLSAESDTLGPLVWFCPMCRAEKVRAANENRKADY